MKKLKTGPLLAEVCKELGYNNTQIADMISRTPSNVGRIFKQDNVNTDTLDLLTEKLGVNLYKYLASAWDKIASEDPQYEFREPEGTYFKHTPKHPSDLQTKPKISLLIEIDADKQNEVLKLLNL